MEKFQFTKEEIKKMTPKKRRKVINKIKNKLYDTWMNKSGPEYIDTAVALGPVLNELVKS